MLTSLPQSWDLVWTCVVLMGVATVSESSYVYQYYWVWKTLILRVITLFWSLQSFFPLCHTAPSALKGELCWHISLWLGAQKKFILYTLPSCEVSVSSHLLQDLLIRYWWRQNKLLILIWIFKYISVNRDFEKLACCLPDWLCQFAFLLPLGGCSLFLTSTPPLVVSWFADLSQSDLGKRKYQSSFHLHFPSC